ncbi:MAG: hypothetical protein BIFFINMI_03131 [Phycisphaerae bacterium]|nr:hypothetical protein [Phycisphaerae bacterium]
MFRTLLLATMLAPVGLLAGCLDADLSFGSHYRHHNDYGRGYYDSTACFAPAPVVVAPRPVVVTRPAPVIVTRPAPVIVNRPGSAVILRGNNDRRDFDRRDNGRRDNDRRDNGRRDNDRRDNGRRDRDDGRNHRDRH